MARVTVLSYQVTYKALTKKLFEENEQEYRKALLYARANELANMGSKMRRMNKPQKNGTKITFEKVASEEELIIEANLINAECVERGIPELLEKVEEDN